VYVVPVVFVDWSALFIGSSIATKGTLGLPGSEDESSTIL